MISKLINAMLHTSIYMNEYQVTNSRRFIAFWYPLCKKRKKKHKIQTIAYLGCCSTNNSSDTYNHNGAIMVTLQCYTDFIVLLLHDAHWHTQKTTTKETKIYFRTQNLHAIVTLVIKRSLHTLKDTNKIRDHTKRVSAKCRYKRASINSKQHSE